MFKKKYENEMGKVTPNQNLINRTKAAMRAEVGAKRKRPVLKTLGLLATAAAVICLCMLGSNVLFDNATTQIANVFALTAYAAEQQPDGTIVIQEQLELNQSEVQQAFILGGSTVLAENGDVVGTYIYADIALTFEGTGIESVTMSADNGRFSIWKAYGEDKEYQIMPLNSTYTMKGDGLSDVIYWGFDLAGSNVRRNISGEFNTITPQDGLITVDDEPIAPQRVTINVVVTFENGEVQEQSIVYEVQNSIRRVEKSQSALIEN